MEKPMQEITAFKASDGRIFETSSEAETYEFQLSWDERVEKFMSSSLCPYPSGAHRAMIQKTIVAWEAYKDGRGSLSYQKPPYRIQDLHKEPATAYWQKESCMSKTLKT